MWRAGGKDGYPKGSAHRVRRMRGGKDGIPERVGILGEKNVGGVKGGIPERVGTLGEKNVGKHAVVAVDLVQRLVCRFLWARVGI